jgi:hypothetical protein
MTPIFGESLHEGRMAFRLRGGVGVDAQASGQVSAADNKMLHDYVLTMAKVKAYETATENAMAAGKSDPSLKAEGDKMSGEPDKTLVDVKAKFAHRPHINAFYAKEGLSMNDAVLVPLTLMSACSVVQYPQIAEKMADSVSPAQIAFCKQNMAALKQTKFVCGGDSE